MYISYLWSEVPCYATLADMPERPCGEIRWGERQSSLCVLDPALRYATHPSSFIHYNKCIWSHLSIYRGVTYIFLLLIIFFLCFSVQITN